MYSKEEGWKMNRRMQGRKEGNRERAKHVRSKYTPKRASGKTVHFHLQLKV